jgi:hypothetical protein
MVGNESFEIGFPENSDRQAFANERFRLAVFGALLVTGELVDILVAYHKYRCLLRYPVLYSPTGTGSYVRCLSSRQFQRTCEHEDFAPNRYRSVRAAEVRRILAPPLRCCSGAAITRPS